jgi:microcystin-dependent protein
VVRSAIMDIVIVGDTAVTLTWEQQIVSSGNATIRIHTDFFDLSNLDTPTPEISWIGQSSNSFTQSSVDASTYSNIIKRGAITANKKYVYVGYGNEIKVYSLVDFTTSGDIGLGTCKKNYTQLTNFILQNDTSALDPFTSLPPEVNVSHVNAGIRDIKYLGNSLYVLSTEYNSISLELESYLYKLDISGVDYLSPVSPTQIYRKKLDYIGSRLQIIGKHIYIAVHGTSLSSDVDQTSLVAIDFDGTYTGGAHIESLRLDEGTVTGDFEIGENAKVHGNINSGGEINSTGSISTGGSFIGLGAVPIGGIIPFAGSTAPNGWLICDGSSILKADYPELYSTLGNSYGSSSLNFNIPDLRQRIPLGYDSSTSSTPSSSPSVGELNYAELGNTGGNNSISPILPIHTHNYEDYTFGSGNSHVWTNHTTDPGTGGTKLKFSANETPETDPTGVDPTISLLDNRMKYLVLNYIIYSGK